MGAGRMRFQRGPSLTKHCETNSSSTSSGAPASSALRSALAMALCSNFSMGPEARFWVKRKVWIASFTFCPRIRSITKRAFCGDMRTCRAPACASISGNACVCASAINYALGAPAAGAAPPAGAAPAVRSSAAFTACPLNVRVGANSPSLCPTICSVTYTGINFRPLCTAMVWPINSGTMVERRDQVLTTFFSLRVFRPSIFSRRCPSTNGPFFSERAIDPLLLHSPQAGPLGPPHLLKSAHWTRHAMRPGTERANKTRARRILNLFHNHRPARLAQLVKHRNRRRDHYFHWPQKLRRNFRRRFSRRGFTGWPNRCALGQRFRHVLDGTFRRALGRHFPAAAPCCGRSCCPPVASCRSHRFSSQLAALRCTARFSRLLRVSYHPKTCELPLILVQKKRPRKKRRLLPALDNGFVRALVVP